MCLYLSVEGFSISTFKIFLISIIATLTDLSSLTQLIRVAHQIDRIAKLIFVIIQICKTYLSSFLPDLKIPCMNYEVVHFLVKHDILTGDYTVAVPNTLSISGLTADKSV